MKLILNNKEENIDKSTINIVELKELKKFTFPKIIVKVNGTIIEPADYESTYLGEGDDVVLLHLLAGG